MVDGHDGGSGWAYAQKLFEVQNFYSLTGHQMVVTSVIINNDFFESLPADIQEGLQRAAREAAVQNMEWMRGYEKDIYGHFEDAGLKINTLDLAPFSDAVRPVWDKYAERVGGQERIDRVLELQAACEQSCTGSDPRPTVRWRPGNVRIARPSFCGLPLPSRPRL
jgi:TRAP-type C4-dicarboxylate transport system substrate-binding protein